MESKYEKIKLGAIINQVRGISYKEHDLAKEQSENYIPVLRANNIYEGKLDLKDLVFVNKARIKETQMVKAGDVIIAASSGSLSVVGKAAQAHSDLNMSFGAFCKLIRPSQKVEAKYIGYFFQSPKYRRTISSLANGANINNIKNEHIDELIIPLPSLEVQKTIVQTLDKAQALIDARKEQIRLMDEVVKSQFVEMFGEPPINKNRWEYKALADVIKNITAGWSANGESRIKKHNEKAVLKVSAVTQGYFKADEYKVINNSEPIKKYVYPQKDDLIFSRANTRDLVGATAIIEHDYPDLLLSDKLWKVLFKDTINVYYMKFILSTQSIRAEFSAQSTGTSGSMYNVSMDKFKEIRVPIPPKELQDSFADFVQKVNKSKLEMQNSLSELNTTQQALMQQYFG